MKNICVFCGSSSGKKEDYIEAAKNLGEEFTQNDWQLVYGGGNIGLMGAVADSVLNHNGKVTGVIPDFLMKKEVGHQQLTRLEIVDSMHTRKNRMAELADAFVALPGGFGTLEELAEIVTWVQLELVDKPIILLNLDGYYDNLLAQLKTMLTEGFTSKQNINIIDTASTVGEVVKKLNTHKSNPIKSHLGKT